MLFRAALPGFSSSCSQALVLCHRTNVGETDGCFIADSVSVRVVNEALDEVRSPCFKFPFLHARRWDVPELSDNSMSRQ
eukprot:15733319-Heterocapsa_arctica.AAC.1